MSDRKEERKRQILGNSAILRGAFSKAHTCPKIRLFQTIVNIYGLHKK